MNLPQFIFATPRKQQKFSNRKYYLLVYDSRQINIQTVRKLDILIEKNRKDYNSPEMKLAIVAHSMGGLVTRYYLRYGSDDALNDNELNYVYTIFYTAVHAA